VGLRPLPTTGDRITDTSAPAVAVEVDGGRQCHQDVSVDVTFYTVSNHTYFLGTVALLNSLRVTGNSEPVVVLDAGLLPEERAALESRTTVVSMPEDRGNPVLLKPFPHVLDASGVIVVIDSDIIVTSSLASITDLAREGRICICPAWADAAQTRWFPEWEETLQLRAPLRREEWFHDGLVVFDTRRWPGLLQRWWEVCELVPSEEIFTSGGAPFNAGDADAINALLMSEIPREGVEVLAQGDEAYAGDVTIDDLATLACSVQGRPARFIHVPDRPKPWERSGWLRRGSHVYLRLMRRLLFSDDAALGLKPQHAPIWLRPGTEGRIALTTLGGVTKVLVPVAQRVPDGVGEQLRRARRKMA
jgi:hypothetical protein